MEVFKLFGSIFINTDAADKSMQKTERKASKVAGVLGNGIKTAAKWGAGIATAAGTAAAAVGGFAVNAADDMNAAMNSFSASTGIAGEKLDQYRGILEDVYNNNYGDSFEEIAEAMALMEQNGMGSLVGDVSEIEKAIEYGYLLQDTYGIAMEESTRGATAMMKQFGITAEDAYNLLAQGAKEGLNQNGDLADQLAEYSVYWADLGFTAEEAFNALQAGAQNGAFQIDYLNDAIKEFGIRAKDNSDGTKGAFEELGLDAEKLTASFAQGGEASGKAFGEVVDALLKCDDQVKQNELGVALFGTKWEDLGAGAVEALVTMNGTINASKDALQQMADVKYDDLGSKIEGIKRNLETSIILPIGESLIPVIESLLDVVIDNMPLIQESVGALAPLITNFIEVLLPPILELLSALLPVIAEIVEGFLPFLVSLFEQLMPLIMEIVNAILPVVMELLQALMPMFMQIVDALMPVLAATLEALMPGLRMVIELLQPIIQLIADLLGPIITVIAEALTPLIEILGILAEKRLKPLMEFIEILAPVFTSALQGLFDEAKPIIDNVIGLFQRVSEFLSGVFIGGFKKVFGGLSKIVKDTFAGLVNLVKFPINQIISLVNAFIDGINEIQIPDWVPLVGGQGINLPHIPMLAAGGDIVEAGRVLVGEKGPEFLDLPAGARVTPLDRAAGGGLTKQDLLDVLTEVLSSGILRVLVELAADDDRLFEAMAAKDAEWKKQHGMKSRFA